METDDGYVISRFPGVIAIAPAGVLDRPRSRSGRLDDRPPGSAHRRPRCRPGAAAHVPRAADAALGAAFCRGSGRPGLRDAGVDGRGRRRVAAHGHAAGHRGHGLGLCDQTLVGRRPVRRHHALGPAARRGDRGRAGRRPGLATEEPVDHAGHRLDQRGLPRPAVPLDEVDVRHVEPHRLLQRRRLRRRAPGPREAHQPAGHVGLLRPGHLGVDADPGAPDSRCRPGLARPARLGSRPAGRRVGLHGASRRC